MSEILLILGMLFFLGVSLNYRTKYREIVHRKKSSEVRLGQIAEHLIPFLSCFTYDPKKTHFLGMPVDFIVFETDKIVFLEIKTGTARLSSTQQQIKKLILEGKVVWEELRLDDKKPVDTLGRDTALAAIKKAGIEVSA